MAAAPPPIIHQAILGCLGTYLGPWVLGSLGHTPSIPAHQHPNREKTQTTQDLGPIDHHTQSPLSPDSSLRAFFPLRYSSSTTTLQHQPAKHDNHHPPPHHLSWRPQLRPSFYAHVSTSAASDRSFSPLIHRHHRLFQSFCLLNLSSSPPSRAARISRSFSAPHPPLSWHVHITRRLPPRLL